MTDTRFRNKAIQKTKENLKKNKTKAKILRVSEVKQSICEWCNNKTRSVTIEFTPTSHKQFDGGFCCYGTMVIFEDKSFHSQAEWFVCGKCENS